VAVRYTSTQLAKAYLSARKVLLDNEQTRIDNSIYDNVPCYTNEGSKILFLLFCVENLDHLASDTDKEKLISKLNQIGKNYPGSISDTEASDFLTTEKGTLLASYL